MHDYLPHVFILRGRRLLFSHGIFALTGLTAVILILFKGVTDRLIPLYAIGAFLAFTLSQAGMVIHWKQKGEHKGRAWHMLVNGTGAIATGITTMVVLASKFRSGAWVTALLIPTLILLMYSVKKHYARVQGEVSDTDRLNLANLESPLVVIPMAGWNRISEKALRFGLLLSKEIKVVHVHSGDEAHGIDRDWDEKILAPIRERGMPEPELVTIPSSFRFIISPLMDYILGLESENPGRKVAVLLPELVVRHWWENLLHNQRVQVLKVLLLLRGNQRIVVVNIPWDLQRLAFQEGRDIFIEKFLVRRTGARSQLLRQWRKQRRIFALPGCLLKIIGVLDERRLAERRPEKCQSRHTATLTTEAWVVSMAPRLSRPKL
jgi:hypothetical protein